MFDVPACETGMAMGIGPRARLTSGIRHRGEGAALLSPGFVVETKASNASGLAGPSARGRPSPSRPSRADRGVRGAGASFSVTTRVLVCVGTGRVAPRRRSGTCGWTSPGPSKRWRPARFVHATSGSGWGGRWARFLHSPWPQARCMSSFSRPFDVSIVRYPSAARLDRQAAGVMTRTRRAVARTGAGGHSPLP